MGGGLDHRALIAAISGVLDFRPDHQPGTLRSEWAGPTQQAASGCNFQLLLPHSSLLAHATKLNPMVAASSNTPAPGLYRILGTTRLPSSRPAAPTHLEDWAAWPATVYRTVLCPVASPTPKPKPKPSRLPPSRTADCGLRIAIFEHTLSLLCSCLLRFIAEVSFLFLHRLLTQA